MRRDRNGEHSDQSDAREGQPQRVAGPVRERRASRDPHQPPVRRRDAPEGLALSSEGDELGAAGEGLDELGRQGAARLGAAARGPTSETGGGQRDDGRAQQQPGGEHACGRGQEGCRRPDRGR